MAKLLSTWCKNAQKSMIDKDMDVNDLAAKLKCTRQYASALVNGRMYSKDVVAKISYILEISEPVGSTITKVGRTKSLE